MAREPGREASEGFRVLSPRQLEPAPRAGTRLRRRRRRRIARRPDATANSPRLREAGETAGALPDASRPSREAAKPAGSVFSLLRQQRRLWSLAARGGGPPSRAHPTGNNYRLNYRTYRQTNKLSGRDQTGAKARPNRRKGRDQTGATARPNRRRTATKPAQTADPELWKTRLSRSATKPAQMVVRH